MNKKDLVLYSTFLAMTVCGILLRNFLGGLMAGIGFTLFLLVTAGRRQAAKAGQRIDNLIQQQRAAVQKGREDGD